MASQNFTAGHAPWCRSKYSYDDECSCGLDGALEGAGERQADSDARATREAADRREKERAEEQAFWDMAAVAFGAALLDAETDEMRDGICAAAAWFADRLLFERQRRSRNQGDDNG